MNIIDTRNNIEIESGDIVITYDDEKYLVIYEKTCIGWYFVNLKDFKFNIEEDAVDIPAKIGDEINGIGKIISVIKSNNIDLKLK